MRSLRGCVARAATGVVDGPARRVDQLCQRSFERLADLQADATAIGFYDTGIVPGLALIR